MHDILFENQANLEITDLKQYGKDIGLDTKKFDKCLDNGEKINEVLQDLADGDAAGVSGTPTFFINGKMVVGALPYEDFETEIEAALQDA